MTAVSALANDAIVVFNEVHYHPAGDDGTLEFVELFNQNAVNVDMSGWRIDGGIQFDFPEGTVLEGGSYLVVAKDPAALEAATGYAGALGPFDGQLANSGEALALYNNNGSFRTLPPPIPPPPAAELWSVDIQANGGTIPLQPPVLMNGPEAGSGLGNVWNAFTVAGHSGTITNPSAALVDSAGNPSALTFSVAGTVSGWSQAGTPLINDYLFVNAGNSAAQADWAVAGLEPGATFSMIAYGGVARNATLTIDVNGDGSYADNAGTLVSGAGTLIDGIVAGADGRIVGRVSQGTVAEGNWGGFQLFKPQPQPPLATGPGRSDLTGRRLMCELDYGDNQPWPIGPDGSGFTLAKRQPGLGAAKPEHWAVSTQPNGSPGKANFFYEAPPEPPGAAVDSIGDADGAVANVGRTSDGGGYEGEAFVFAGSGFVQVPVDINPAAHAQVAIGAWVKPSVVNNPARYEIISSDNGGYDRAITIDSRTGGTEANNPRYGAFGGNGTGLVNGPAASASDDWTFICAVFDQTAGTTTLYVNGSVTSGAATHNASQTFLRIGSHPNGIEFFSGLIDNAFVIAGAPSAGEIDAIRAGGAAAIKAHPNALALYEFEDGPAGGPTVPPLVALPSVALNELSGTSEAGDFAFELHNFGSDPVDLGGMVVASSDPLASDFALPAGALAPGAFMSLGESDLGYRPADGDRLFLLTPAGDHLIDAALVGARAKARQPDGTGRWLRPSAPTFGAANAFAIPGDVVINEIMYHPYPDYGTGDTPATYDDTVLLGFGDAWRFNDEGTGLPGGWAASAHPADGITWKNGNGLIGFETALLPSPGIVTEINPFDETKITYYFETEFEFSGDPSGIELVANHIIDDGAVFYLNGVEAGRYRMGSGVVDPSTLADGAIEASVGTLTLAKDALVAGTNRISVEVHQGSATSSDVVFGAEIVARVELTPFVPGNPFSDRDGEEFIELHNRGAAAVNLDGWQLSGGISFRFPNDASIPAGGYAVVVRDYTGFADRYPAAVAQILGEYSGGLGDAGDAIVLEDPDGNPADEVTYYESGRWSEFADGGGPSLELRDPRADNADGGSWEPSDESARGAWQTYTYRMAALDDGIGNNVWHEFLLGMLDAGEVLIDDVSVVEDPDGAAIQFIQNGDFEADAAGAPPAKWRLIGTHGSHGRSVVVADPDDAGNQCLRLVATGPTEDKHNKAETTFANGEQVTVGQTYEISFRAKWLRGSNQVNTRLYFNYCQRTTLIDVPPGGGTPGAQNSAFAANAGPVIAEVWHEPAVPVAGETFRVFARVGDPDGLGVVTAHVLGSSFESFGDMADQGGGVLMAEFPGPAAAQTLQLDITANDAAAGQSVFPAVEGEALIPVVASDLPSGRTHSLRIVMLDADRDLLMLNTNRMSNDRLPGTVIYDEREIYYGVGVRLKASAFGRFQQAHYGFNLEFDPGQPFRGVHTTISLERAPNFKEILAKQMLNRAGGGMWSMYDDVCQLVNPTPGDSGTALIAMARNTDRYFECLVAADGGGEGGGTLFNHELLYQPNGAVGGDPEALKLNNPYNHTNGRYDHMDRGDDKEPYRWGFQIRSARRRDDYGAMIALGKAVEQSGGALTASVAEVIDVDQWMRTFAMMALNGNDDFYTRIWEHNFRMYQRPSDGKLIALPWDLDRAFQLATNSPLVGGNSIGNVINQPEFKRIFDGHILNIVQTTANADYLAAWAAHYGELTGQNFTAQVNWVGARAAFAQSQLPAELPFEITTNGGADFSVAASSAVLQGNGWIDVSEIRRASDGVPYALTWLDPSTWKITVPLDTGANAIALEAFNLEGVQVGGDAITITNSSTTALAAAGNAVISEMMFNPEDGEENEFIEVRNISGEPVDFSGARFSDGIEFTFPGGSVVPPGGVLVVASDAAAFALKYPGVPLAGEYSGQLNNGGESIELVGVDLAPIQSFAYSDAAPWPASADGGGYSLILLYPQDDPDHALPLSWSSSAQPGGNPGGADDVAVDHWLAQHSLAAFEPLSNNEGDSLVDLLENGFDSDPGADSSALLPQATVEEHVVEDTIADYLTIRFRRHIGVSDIRYAVEESGDLIEWFATAVHVGSVNNDDGTETVTYRASAPVSPDSRGALRVVVWVE
ncbi:MAG: lamin tail domain-containing protein [Verrucomicrobiales bacterium]